MATSKIKAPFKIGTVNYVDTFPFTPTKDGIMVAEVEGKNITGGKTMFYLNANTRPVCRISFASDGTMNSTAFPIKAGEILSLYYQDNIYHHNVYFFPFDV